MCGSARITAGAINSGANSGAVQGRTAARLAPLGTLGPFIALLAACAFFASQTDRFLTGGNLSLILQQVMVVGVIAIGQTLAIACGIGVTTLFGLANGLLVTRIKLPSFIVTLGTLNIAFAITQLYSKS